LGSSIEVIQDILLGLGWNRSDLVPDRHLRSDLGLDSTETTELELEIERRLNRKVDLWDRSDYRLADLANLVDEANSAD
jgi:acyl carrier protein